jgi:predicted nucleic acid-binding protein
MTLPVAFWDSTALVLLCIPQAQTSAATALYDRYGVVAWWATQVEMMSELTQLEKMGQISRDQFLNGKRMAQDIARGWISAGSSASVAAEACSLLELYPLRASNALQLSVALEACEHKPQGYVFVTADQRLAEAARRSGFAVEYLLEK